MTDKNIIIISLDEVRPDHLSCYGYDRIKTTNIDQIAKEGVRFEICISSSDFTPIAMGSVITGKYPNKHGMRDAYSHLNGPTIANILKENGYRTAGFVGNGLLAKQHGFAEGFDYWSETSKEKSWAELRYAGSNEVHYEGNYWVEEFFKWLEENYSSPFFMWGHLYETHESSETTLLEKGLIKKDELSEFSYYDAKIKMADEKLIHRLIESLKELGIYKNTTIVIMSDHGTNLEDRPAGIIPWRDGKKRYPQHTTMYDHDLKVALIIKDNELGKGKVVKGSVGSIDLAPTLLELTGISSDNFDLDGKSLMMVTEKGRSEGRSIYSEDLFEARGKGALQSLRTDDYKFIRNLTLGTEEWYDLRKDPQEHENLIDTIDENKIIDVRKKLNVFLREGPGSKGKSFSKEEKEMINKRLRALGYIE